MRTALDQAIGSPTGGYAAGLALGQPVLAIHIQELRDRVKNNWNIGCLTIDQFISNFYQGALARQPNSNESQSWSSQLHQAYYQGHLLTAVQYMGRQIFKSQAYANRYRNDHDYVHDLYLAYLQREPDPGGWTYWESDVAANGRDHTRIAFETDTIEFAPKVASVCAGSTSSAPIPFDGLASLTYDNTSNRITTAGFTYDAAGNQTRIVRADGSGQTFKYDAANRLIQVRDDYGYVLETFTYGDSNERLIADEGGYRTYFDCEGGSTTAEYYESAGSINPLWSKSYVYLGGRLLSTVVPTGNGGEAIQFHHPDRLGTRLVTDPTSGSSFEQVSLPFGTALNAESTGETNRRFTSYDRSATTGLDYANNRQYDSQQGRFTQVDPAGMRAVSLTSPQTLNLYAYCANDPVNHLDPSGLGFFSFLKKVFSGIAKFLVKVLTNKWVLLVAGIALGALAGLGFYLAATITTQFYLGAAIALAAMSAILIVGAFHPNFLKVVKTLGGFSSALQGVAGIISGTINAGMPGTPPWNPNAGSGVGAIPNYLVQKKPPPRRSRLVLIEGPDPFEMLMSDPMRKTPAQQLERKMAEGKAWDDWYKYQSCAHAIWVEYKEKWDKAVHRQIISNLLVGPAAGVAITEGGVYGTVAAGLGVAKVVYDQNNELSDLNDQYRKDVSKTCGPAPNHP
jgi:RHS repeat-associated protein